MDTLMGIRVFSNPALVVGPFEDWSKVRSPARARRRRRHRQNICYYFKPDPQLIRTADAIFGHPETIAALRLRLAATQAKDPDPC